jgi:hypothetical protein
MSVNEYDALLSPAAPPAGPAADSNEYDTLLAGDVATDRVRLRQSLYGALEAQPDRYAGSVALAQQTGLPAAVVDRNREVVERRVKLDEYDALLADQPALRERFADPEFAKVAHDDVQNLVKITGTIQSIENPATAGSVLKGLWQSTKSAVPRMRTGIELAVHDFFSRGTVADEVRTQNLLRKVRSQAFDELVATPQFDSRVGRYVYGGTASIIQNTPGIAASVATGTPAPALALAAVQTGAPAYAKYRERGGTPEQAALGAGIETGAEVLFELAPMGFLVDKLGKVGAGEFLKGYFGRELPSELATTLAQTAIDTAVANPEKSWADWGAELPDALAATGVAVAMQSGVVTGAGATMRRFAEQAEAAQTAEQTKTIAESLVTLATESRLRERSPAAFEEAVAAATKDAPVTDVYIAAEEVAALFQDKVPEVFADAPEVLAQYAEALSTGGDLIIPIPIFAARLAAKPEAAKLIDHIRFDATAMSANEAKEFQKTQAKVLETEAKRILEERTEDDAWRASAEAVRTNVLSQLQATQRFRPEVNESYATLASSFYTVQAERLGITPEEMFARYPLTVRAQQMPGVVFEQGTDVSLRDWTEGEGNPQFLLHITEPTNVEAIKRGGLKAAGDGFNYAWDSQLDAESDQIMREARMSRGMSYDEAADAGTAFIAIDRAAVADRIEQDPYTGEVRIKGDIPASALRFLDDSLLQTYDKLKRGAYNPETGTVTLLKDADLTTFLHELGHFQLEVLADIAAKPDAPADVQADMAAVLKWFKVPDLDTWHAMTLEQKREHHEKFARGFEAYLFKGESPNEELRTVFGRFRAWLVQVYKTLKSLNVRLTPEVEQVFGRLLASRESIAAAEERAGYRAIFVSAEQAGMTAEQWLAYQAKGTQATAEAQDDLERRSLKDMQWLSNTKSRALAKLQKQHDAARKAIQAEVEAEVAREPVYAAIAFLKQGVLPERLTGRREDIAQLAGLEGYKLSLPALKEMYGEGPAAPWRYLAVGAGGLAATDGMHPDMVAELFGYDSGDALVRALLAAPPLAEVVAARTDARMLERHGELVDPQAVERAADAAVHNEARAKFVADELRALEKANAAKVETGKTRTGRRMTANAVVQAAKDYATRAVAAMKLSDLRRHHRYAVAEGKSARAAEKALKAGDLTAAAQAKRSQILAGSLLKASQKAADEADRALKYLSKFQRAGTRDNLADDYLEQIDALLERVDLRRLSGKEVARRQSLASWVEQQREQGIEPALDADLLESIGRKPFSQLTLEEMRGLVDAVKGIEHLGRLKQKLLTAKDKREFDAVVEDITTSIETNATRTVPEERSSDRGVLVHPKRMGRRFLSWNRKFASLIREMDGFKDNGVFWSRIVRPANDAADLEARLNAEATEALTKILKPVLSDRALGKKRHFASMDRSFSREEILSIALHQGTEINRERVLTGEGLTEANVVELLDTLTEDDWNVVRAVWAHLDSYRPLIAEKQKRVDGVEPDWVEGADVVTKFGTFKGGYFPIAYDPLRAKGRKARQQTAAELQQQMERGIWASAQTRRGHLKARVESTGRPLRFDLNVITDHVAKVVHDLAWHEYLIDANRLLRSDKVAAAITKHHGVDVLKEMETLMKDIAVGNNPAAMGSPILNHLRYGVSIAGLSFNLMNTIINITGLTQSMERIGAKWVWRGAAHWFGDAMRLESATKKMREKSSFMKLRAQTMFRELNELRNKVSGQGSRFHAVAFLLQTKTQAIVDVPTWWGAYEKAMAQPDMTEETAIALADQAVRDAQGSGQLHDLSGVQRDEVAKNFTVFYSFFNVTFNRMAEAVNRTDFRNPRDVALLAVDTALLAVLPSILYSLLTGLGKGDDEDELISRMLRDQVAFIFGLLPFVREATGAAQAAGGMESHGYTGPAATRFFVDLHRLGVQIGQVPEDGFDEGFWKAANAVGGTLFHYPSVQIQRTTSGAQALASGETSDPTVLITGARQ